MPTAPIIHFPTEEESKAALAAFIAGQQAIRAERRDAIQAAVPALERLIATFAHRTGQSYKLRALLYSMWNGQATEINEVLALDWSLRKDFAAVLLAFGDGFFYEEMKSAIVAAGQFDWFLEAHQPAK